MALSLLNIRLLLKNYRLSFSLLILILHGKEVSMNTPISSSDNISLKNNLLTNTTNNKSRKYSISLIKDLVKN